MFCSSSFVWDCRVPVFWTIFLMLPSCLRLELAMFAPSFDCSNPVRGWGAEICYTFLKLQTCLRLQSHLFASFSPCPCLVWGRTVSFCSGVSMLQPCLRPFFFLFIVFFQCPSLTRGRSWDASWVRSENLVMGMTSRREGGVKALFHLNGAWGERHLGLAPG